MIELVDVSFHYENEEENGNKNGALCQVNLEIPTGQTVLLCGESGCGKTTITRLLNGLIPHFYEGELTGQVKINGTKINEQPLYDTAFLVGTVFQNPRTQFFNVDTTSELAFGLENRGADAQKIKERVDQTVKELQIQQLKDRSIFHLSGGEKQKIACGCVSVCEPEVIILDEPSANLDLSSMKHLRVMIRKWKEQGKTIVIAEHRLAYIWDLIDRAVYMKNGKVEQDLLQEEIQKMSEEQLHLMGLRSNKEILFEKKKKDQKSNGANILLKDFVFGYEKQKKLLNLKSVCIPENEITAVIGQNGMGKTTFLRCVCGLESKCKGIMEKGQEIYKRKKRLNSIFLVMQDVDHQLFTESVMDEVLISMKQEDEEKALKILEALDLLEFRNRHPISLSGGQKQRVAIATAIASERSILLFDEPTSGLDYRHMLQVANLFRDLQKKGKTLIVVTHDPEFIRTIGAHVIELEEKLA